MRLNKLKVLHIAETIKGGVATILDQLLEDSRIESLAIVPEQHVDQLENKLKCIVFNRSGRNLISFFYLLITFIKQLRSFNPDIIHIHSSFAGVICRLYLILTFNKKIKIVYCPHAFSFLMNVSNMKKKIYAYLELFLSKYTDFIICTSYFERNQGIFYGIDDGILKVVYNGIKPPIDYELIQKPDFPENKINILFVGRFDYQKAFDFVVNISEKLPENILLTIIGDYVNNSEKYIIPSSVNHIKWVDKKILSGYYYCADIVFMPSRWESFGLVAVEANSYGTPVLASNKSSLPEIIIDKENGFLFNNFDVNEVLKIIKNLNKEDLSKMAPLCVESYKKNFSGTGMLNNLYSLYTQLYNPIHINPPTP